MFCACKRLLFLTASATCFFAIEAYTEAFLCYKCFQLPVSAPLAVMAHLGCLVFRFVNGEVRAMAYESGCVITDANESQFDITDDPSRLRVALNRMTMDGIDATLRRLHFQTKRGKGIQKQHMVEAFIDKWDEIRANAQTIFAREVAVPDTATDTRASGSAGSGSGGYQPFGGTAHRLTLTEETNKEADEVHNIKTDDPTLRNLIGDPEIDALIQEGREQGLPIHVVRKNDRHVSDDGSADGSDDGSDDDTERPKLSEEDLIDIIDSLPDEDPSEVHRTVDVTVKEFKGKKLFTMKTSINNSVGSLKDLIVGKIGWDASGISTISTEDFKLICFGKTMKNEESVGDYVTDDDDELVCHILLVLKGGGKRRITPAETLPRESDPEDVKALLNEKTFNIRQFVKTLTADELQADIEMLTSRVEVVRDHLTGLISTSLGELNKGELLAMVRLLAE
ncbi:unnamed protein product [Symbiodinium microadriaticum]|nr:unnamed protein product [Symbiodinium microadriaticum]